MVDQACLTQEWCFPLEVKAKGKIVTIAETTSCKEPGVYTFDVMGDKLRTEKVNDSCTTERGRVFDGVTWTRRG